MPPSLRTPERLNETGGNLHRERFYDEIIGNLDSPGGFSYRVSEKNSYFTEYKVSITTRRKFI